MDNQMLVYGNNSIGRMLALRVSCCWFDSNSPYKKTVLSKLIALFCFLQQSYLVGTFAKEPREGTSEATSEKEHWQLKPLHKSNSVF